MVSPPHRLLLLIEDDVLFYPRFVTRLLALSPIPIIGIVIARPKLKHNRYLRALKTIRYFRMMELFKLLSLRLKSRETIAQIAAKHSIPSIVAQGSVNTPEIVAWLNALAPTIIFSASPLIVGHQLLASVRHAVNMHFSMLPAYKGIMPLFHAMVAGEEMSGISLHAMTEKIDEGLILHQTPVPLRYDQSLIANYQTFFDLAPQCVISVLQNLQYGVTASPPPSGKAPSYFRHPDDAAWKAFRARKLLFI